MAPASSRRREARPGRAWGRRPPPRPGDGCPRHEGRRRSPRPPLRRLSAALCPPAGDFQTPRPPPFSSGARRTARRSAGRRGRAGAVQPGQRDTSPPPPRPSCAAARHAAGSLAPGRCWRGGRRGPARPPESSAGPSPPRCARAGTPARPPSPTRAAGRRDAGRPLGGRIRGGACGAVRRGAESCCLVTERPAPLPPRGAGSRRRRRRRFT